MCICACVQSRPRRATCGRRAQVFKLAERERNIFARWSLFYMVIVSAACDDDNGDERRGDIFCLCGACVFAVHCRVVLSRCSARVGICFQNAGHGRVRIAILIRSRVHACARSLARACLCVRACTSHAKCKYCKYFALNLLLGRILH